MADNRIIAVVGATGSQDGGQRGRFEGPADFLQLDRLEAQVRRGVYVALAIALVAVGSLFAVFILVEEEERVARPIFREHQTLSQGNAAAQQIGPPDRAYSGYQRHNRESVKIG